MKLIFEGDNLSQILGQMSATLDQHDPRRSQPVLETRLSPGLSVTAPEPQGSSPEEVEPVKVKPSKAKATKSARPDPGETPPAAPAEADPFQEDAPDPAELVRIRTSTIEELQAAFSGGKQAKVFALLKKHGNGAKSFRELTPEAFAPIRKAIDEGALA